MFTEHRNSKPLSTGGLSARSNQVQPIREKLFLTRIVGSTRIMSNTSLDQRLVSLCSLLRQCATFQPIYFVIQQLGYICIAINRKNHLKELHTNAPVISNTGVSCKHTIRKKYSRERRRWMHSCHHAYGTGLCVLHSASMLLLVCLYMAFFVAEFLSLSLFSWLQFFLSKWLRNSGVGSRVR